MLQARYLPQTFKAKLLCGISFLNFPFQPNHPSQVLAVHAQMLITLQHSAALGKCSHTQGKGYLLRICLFEKQSPNLGVWSEGCKEPEAEERTKAAALTVLGQKPDTGNCKGLCCFSCPHAEQETAKQGWKKPPLPGKGQAGPSEDNKVIPLNSCINTATV